MQIVFVYTLYICMSFCSILDKNIYISCDLKLTISLILSLISLPVHNSTITLGAVVTMWLSIISNTSIVCHKYYDGTVYSGGCDHNLPFYMWRTGTMFVDTTMVHIFVCLPLTDSPRNEKFNNLLFVSTYILISIYTPFVYFGKGFPTPL